MPYKRYTVNCITNDTVRNILYAVRVMYHTPYKSHIVYFISHALHTIRYTPYTIYRTTYELYAVRIMYRTPYKLCTEKVTDHISHWLYTVHCTSYILYTI